jgi:phage terminase large subunit
LTTVDCGYRPRPQFIPFHQRTQRWATIVAHRRCGKTVACIHDLHDAALRCKLKRPQFAYLAPFYSQAKSVGWAYLRDAVAPLRALGATTHESELRADYPNGGRVRLLGADNAEALRGLYLDGVVLDEFGDFDPRVWPEILRPALADRKGWAVFIGTPKGRNHFYQIVERAKNDPEWFSLTLKASETGLVDPEELRSAQRDMSEDQYAREFECSFDAAVQGAYFGRLLREAGEQGRVGSVVADPILPLRAFIDIGGAGKKSDAFTIVVTQWVGDRILVLDSYEAVGQVLAAHINWIRSKGYEKNTIFYLPHDGVNADIIFGKRVEDHLRDAELNVEPSIPNQGPGAAKMRIEALRRLFPRLWFNEETTRGLRDALAYYHERMDEKRNVGLGPDHDWSSHFADATGLMACVYEAPETGRVKPEIYQPRQAGGWMG